MPPYGGRHTRSGATTHVAAQRYFCAHTLHILTCGSTLQTQTMHACRKPEPTRAYMSVPTHVHRHCTHIRPHTLHPHNNPAAMPSHRKGLTLHTHACTHTSARTHVCSHTPTHTCQHTLYRHWRQPPLYVGKGPDICAEIFNTDDPANRSHITARKNATTNMHIHVCAHTPPHTYGHTHFTHKRAHTSGRTHCCGHLQWHVSHPKPPRTLRHRKHTHIWPHTVHTEGSQHTAHTHNAHTHNGHNAAVLFLKRELCLVL
jgi:hypothetical protein